MKRIWTSKTAAAELGISVRHLMRILDELGIKPSSPEIQTRKGGQRRFYIFGMDEMRQLRSRLSA